MGPPLLQACPSSLKVTLKCSKPKAVSMVTAAGCSRSLQAEDRNGRGPHVGLMGLAGSLFSIRQGPKEGLLSLSDRRPSRRHQRECGFLTSGWTTPAPPRGRLGAKGSGSTEGHDIQDQDLTGNRTRPPSPTVRASLLPTVPMTHHPETSPLLIQLPVSRGPLLSNRIRKNRVTAGV